MGGRRMFPSILSHSMSKILNYCIDTHLSSHIKKFHSCLYVFGSRGNCIYRCVCVCVCVCVSFYTHTNFDLPWAYLRCIAEGL